MQKQLGVAMAVNMASALHTFTRLSTQRPMGPDDAAVSAQAALPARRAGWI